MSTELRTAEISWIRSTERTARPSQTHARFNCDAQPASFETQQGFERNTYLHHRRVWLALVAANNRLLNLQVHSIQLKWTLSCQFNWEQLKSLELQPRNARPTLLKHTPDSTVMLNQLHLKDNKASKETHTYVIKEVWLSLLKTTGGFFKAYRLQGPHTSCGGSTKLQTSGMFCTRRLIESHTQEP